MAGRPTLYITDEDPKAPGGAGRQPDHVAFAIAPIDAFTGQIVRHGLRVRIQDTPAIRPVENQSGLFVFINIADALRVVRIEAEAAGYFDAEITVAPPPDPNDRRQRLHSAPLLPRPVRSFPDGTTLVRGKAVRAAEAIAGIQIEAEAADGFAFSSRTDAKGAFVVPLRLATEELVPSEPVEVTFTFTHEALEHEFTVPVRPGRAWSFAEPIDLATENVPPLVDPQPRPGP